MNVLTTCICKLLTRSAIFSSPRSKLRLFLSSLNNTILIPLQANTRQSTKAMNGEETAKLIEELFYATVSFNEVSHMKSLNNGGSQCSRNSWKTRGIPGPCLEKSLKILSFFVFYIHSWNSVVIYAVCKKEPS